MPKRKCIYCGGPAVRIKKGEHVLPDALGGKKTLGKERPVCSSCNNRYLSQLDTELCRRSYLSAIASRELGSHLWQAWEVAHGSQNQLLEAKPVWNQEGELTGLSCWPQIVFEESGPEYVGDVEDFRHFGRDDSQKVLFNAAREAYRRFTCGERSIHFERVRTISLRSDYRFPPRLYTTHNIAETAMRSRCFILRYENASDKHFALNKLANLSELRKSIKPAKWKELRGSVEPTISFIFDAGDTARAFIKTGLNLIAAFCTNTEVNPKTFAHAIHLVRSKSTVVSQKLVLENGFLFPNESQGLATPKHAHAFRLVHFDEEQQWRLHLSFFGGQVEAVATFPGPNQEDWNTIDIVAPINSNDWKAESSKLILPVPNPRGWQNVANILPSIKFQESQTTISVDRVRKR